mmetsp:Transcript_53659/g.165038  ORF Transcript_53659/g.165038 Transcript_53659/m.165038 type:complete len:241 (-) Transcript_53659:1061-1783(-)
MWHFRGKIWWRPRRVDLLLRDAVVHVGKLVRVRNGRGVLERFLHQPHADETLKEISGARLVVGARCARAAERLLANHGTSALVVDVQVASGVVQAVLRDVDGVAVTREDRARQAVLSTLVDCTANVLPCVGSGIVVHVRRHDGAEDLLLQQAAVERRGFNQRRGDEPALVGARVAAGEHRAVRVVLRDPDVLGRLVEGNFIDVGAHEVAEVLGATLLDLRDLVEELFLDPCPLALRDEEA